MNQALGEFDFNWEERFMFQGRLSIIWDSLVKQNLFYLLFVALCFLGAALAPASRADAKPIQEFDRPKTSPPKATHGSVAVLQWNPAGSAPLTKDREVAERFKARNRHEMARFITEAAKGGAEMVITPEFATVGYPDIPDLPDEDDNFRNRKDIEPYVEPLDGPTQREFSELAKELGVIVHVGFAEHDQKTNRFYNSVMALGADGKLLGSFRKVNLFKKENDFLSAGSQAVTYESPFGKVGFAICADIYDPDLLRRYKELGTDVIALSTSWAQYNTGMSYFRRAARDINVFVLAANMTYFPDSGVISPNGELQSHIRQSSGLAWGYLPRINKKK